MATNQIVAAARLERRDGAAPKADLGLAAIAFLLALVLGLSAVDIQRQRISDPSPSEKAVPSQTIIDGRGKWGGIF